MRIDPAGWPFVGAAVALALVAGWFVNWAAASPALALAAILLFFFRDPKRTIPDDANLVVSPADGRVLVAGVADRDARPPGEWQQISVFLSPIDVHVNRVPISGRITSVTYTPGRFLPAYSPDAASANERCEIWIDHAGQQVVARQVVGILARRVVCRLRPGAVVATGDRYGIMKFGSRMDVFVPVTARLQVAIGDIVRGGETAIAMLHSNEA